MKPFSHSTIIVSISMPHSLRRNRLCHFFGYYNGYIYKLIDRIYNKHGAKGLRIEIKYIIQYLMFLFNKIKSNYIFEDYVLVVFYFRLYYKHITYRKNTFSNQLNFDF